MIPGDLLSAFPHRQFHTLPGLLDSWAALPNSNPNACMPMQGGSLHHFYDSLWYDPAERRTHDLPCERRTRYRLSQPNTVRMAENGKTYFECVSINFRSYLCIFSRQASITRQTFLITALHGARYRTGKTLTPKSSAMKSYVKLMRHPQHWYFPQFRCNMRNWLPLPKLERP